MRAALLPLLAVLALSSCSTPEDPVVCTAIAVPALSVTVLDAQTGAALCDAQVTAVDGSFRAQLDTFPGDLTACVYSGPYERAGVYTVQVSREGYRPASVPGIRVGADVCHVQTQRVTVPLSR